MKTIQNLFDAPWAEALGWSLLHSLWQGFVIILLVALALKIIGLRSSQLRYVVTSAGLALTLLCAIATFVVVLDTESTLPSETEHALASSADTARMLTLGTSSTRWTQVIESNMNIILSCWIAGALLFSLRICGGWMFVSSLRKNAVMLGRDNEWNAMLSTLADQLAISRTVLLATSEQVNAPMVIGYLKPMILIPAGMFSGLTTEQIETIFLHELAHIRRHDYLVNLVQSFVEALLFFNPFVWMLSNMIRREREYCCDDAVITRHGSAMAYARALTRLEEIRLSNNMLALSLGGNKNQLLNRIKRIMEKSVKTYSGRDRLVPAVLLIVGLACASWITINAQDPGKKKSRVKENKETKTAPREERKSADGYIIPIDPVEPVPAEEPEDVHAFILPVDPHFNLPEPPDVWIELPGMPAMDMMMPAMPMTFMLDTGKRAYRWRNTEQWKAFNDEFEQKFKERFEDFYKKNGKDLSKMMDELAEKFQQRFDGHAWHAMEADMARMAAMAEARVSDEAMQEAFQAQREALEHLREIDQINLENLTDQLHDSQIEIDEHMKEVEEGLREMEMHMKAFEDDLKEELVNDGYLKKNESIGNMQWHDNGELTINGKKIKKEHEQKYRDLHRKHFKKSQGLRIVE